TTSTSSPIHHPSPPPSIAAQQFHTTTMPLPPRPHHRRHQQQGPIGRLVSGLAAPRVRMVLWQRQYKDGFDCGYSSSRVINCQRENEKIPFILGTPFLTTAKAAIKFDKGTITLRSGKSKISFYRIHDSPCMIKKGVKNDIEPIALTMTVNSLVLEWKEKIKFHLEREMEFNQWRSKFQRQASHSYYNQGRNGR
nr:hypothetical protein [Tanacetum cinerariifolium]